MNLLINQEELAASLARKLLRNKFHTTPFRWNGIDQYVKECRAEYRRSQHIVIDFNHVNKLINKEINAYKQHLSEQYKNQIKIFTKLIIDKNYLDRFPKNFLIKTYINDAKPAFTKDVGKHFANHHFITNFEQANLSQPTLIRNVLNNESVLSHCMKNNLPFWFIDTGYTNFLEPKLKKWHRLVKNHIHHGPLPVQYPSDRLHLLPSLPRSWRKKGRTILVVESSENHYQMMGTSKLQWRNDIEQQIRQYSDRPIEFRPKHVCKKTRQSVYDLLMSSKHYHCVISDCSNAATEAIWAGIPAITLSRHITNSVTRSNIAEVEHLYKGDLEQWICAISYNQFTFEELSNGTALEIINRYESI